MLNETKLREYGIDVEQGLAYCAEDPEFYEEMLREYVNEAEMKTEELREFFDAQDWGNYAIRVHSLKNTSKMIGAEAFGERARELEFAAKEGNEAVILDVHAAFLTDYQALAGSIQESIG